MSAAPSRSGGRSLLRAAFTVGGLTLLSRVCGFVRDVAIAAVGGAGVVTDAFFIALAIPNFFRRLFGEGAFSAAFTPMFAGKLETDGRAAARAFAERALAVLLPVLLIFVAALELGAPQLLAWVWLDPAADAERYGYALEFLRITLIYLVFICLVAMFGGVLNALDRFAAMAAAPILFNLCLIAAAALHAASGFGATVGHALAWAVALSGAAQLVLLIVCARREGMGLIPRPPRWGPDVARLIRLMGPAAAAHGVVQFNLIVGSALAASLVAGAVSHLYYADRINQLPLGVVGVAIATALLPKLAASLRGGRPDEALETQSRAFEATLFLGLPAAAALALAGETIVAGLFQRGDFTADDAAATGRALAMYALGLPAMLLAKSLQTILFSRETPGAAFKASLVSVGANLAAAFALIGPMGHVGLALAVTIGAWANVAALVVLLRRADALGVDARCRSRVPRIALAAAAMGVVVVLVDGALAGWSTDAAGRLARLLAVVAAGGATYAIAALALRAVAPADLKAWTRRGRAAETGDL